MGDTPSGKVEMLFKLDASTLESSEMRDNPHPARAIQDLCPLEGVLVPPERAVDR